MMVVVDIPGFMSMVNQEMEHPVHLEADAGAQSGPAQAALGAAHAGAPSGLGAERGLCLLYTSPSPRDRG